MNIHAIAALLLLFACLGLVVFLLISHKGKLPGGSLIPEPPKCLAPGYKKASAKGRVPRMKNPPPPPEKRCKGVVYKQHSYRKPRPVCCGQKPVCPFRSSKSK
ncbi:hypothetical protein [Leeuwenhoekiella sp. CH_XMU1409-2]|uniref:hypothetical protein n=1 Tax=Leeuwenhoekiella sp. CH_XMU1409-2 TaxID=3107768 RepID=UPI0030080673